MTKLTFLKRLKKMLIRYPDDACGHCPVAENYDPLKNLSNEVCAPCEEIMDLCDLSSCPCAEFGPQTAIARAWEVINAWEVEHGSLA